jgi:hypothetical protein
MRSLTLLILLSFIAFSSGCNNCGTAKPSNPFAQNLQTVPPPATFSSQAAYLGQTPGNFVPQTTPATTFPSSGTIPATNNDSDRATVFAATEKESGWTPVDIAATGNTIFQAMDEKVHLPSTNDGGILTTASGVSKPLVVGTSPAVTAIVDDSPPASVLTEPQLLYTGQYAQ